MEHNVKKIINFPTNQNVRVSIDTSIELLDVYFTEKEWGLVLNGKFALRKVKDIIDNTVYTYTLLFNDNNYPDASLLVFLDNPNHFISETEIFTVNIEHDAVEVVYDYDKDEIRYSKLETL